MPLSPDFTVHLASLFDTTLHASWQGSLAISAVLLARLVLGARVPARWHYLLWLLVVARLLLPAFILPHSPASLENIPMISRPLEHLPSAHNAPEEIAPAKDEAALSQKAAPLHATTALAEAPETPRSAAFPWKFYAASLWLLGIGGLACWVLASTIHIRRCLRYRTAPASDDIASLWHHCCKRWLGWRNPPRLLMAHWVRSPALVGIWRPTLLIPEQKVADSIFSTEDWEHIFAHEIAHLHHRDPWTQLLVIAAWGLHWFNPVVWFGFRRLRADRELAADEWALGRWSGERSIAYGETLFKTLAIGRSGYFFQPGMVGISEDGGQMKLRLCRIVGFLPQRRLLASCAGFVVLVLLSTILLGQGSGDSSTKGANDSLSLKEMVSTAEAFPKKLLAAAKAGDSGRVAALLKEPSASRAPLFNEEAATKLLNKTIEAGELPAFTTLYNKLRETSFGNRWKISDNLLMKLVKDGRTDFLDALLARRLNLKTLADAKSSASPATAEWITRRIAEATKERKEIDALGEAAAKGDIEAIQRLLSGGIDINSVATDNNTPLIRAVLKDQVEAAKYLLDHGAEVDKPRLPGWDYTPLCLVRSVAMASLLKERGANVHAKLWGGTASILFYAKQHASFEVVEWFLKQGLAPKMIGQNKQNLLFFAKDPRIVAFLVKAGADPNHLDEFNNPPLASAANEEAAKALIDHGAKVTGFKPPLLTKMIGFGSAGAMEAALKAGTEHDSETLQMALVAAAHRDSSEMAAVLLKHGADPNKPGFWNIEHNMKTLPLEACCVHNGRKTAKLLLDAGANPNGGQSPDHLLLTAMHNGNKEVAKLLREAGAKSVPDLAFYVSTQDEAKVKELLKTAPSFKENEGFWKDALSSAATVGDVKTVRAALAKGVPADGEQNAYYAAAFEGQHEVLALLLKTGTFKKNPLILSSALWAAVYNSHPYEEQRPAKDFEKCVEMLLNAGALQDKKSDIMTSAVFTRNPGGNPKVLEMLVRAGANPNPLAPTKEGPKVPLLDAIGKACEEGLCSQITADTLIKLNNLISKSVNH